MYWPSLEAPVDISHRRLSTPNYVDIVVIVGLSGLLFYLLYVLLKQSHVWRLQNKQRVKEVLDQRRHVRDEFRTENGYSWDFCMVFKVYNNRDNATELQNKWNLKYILRELTRGGFQTKSFYSAQADEVYVKIRAPLDRLLREADRIDLKLPLNPENLKKLLKEGRREGNKELWGPVNIPDTSVETPLSPYDYIYARYEYDRPEVANLYHVWDNHTVFRGVDRLKLMYSIMTARKVDGGCNLDVYRIIKDGAMLGFFPLHDKLELLQLQEKWLVYCQYPWDQPIDDVKNYFGEKIGLYFLWLAHYTSWLMFAGVIGFFCWINVAVEGNDPNAVIMPYFATFMALWATLFLEFWKRKESRYAMMWGMSGFESEEQDRPQFEGVTMASPVTGQDYLYFPRRESSKRRAYSLSIISAFIALVVAVVGSIFILKLVLSRIKALTYEGTQLGGIIAAIANAIQIQVMNIIYGGVAIKLTNYENHRTDTAYEDSLIGKTFVFQFVNSFAALFYIAFVKPFLLIDPCLGPCLSELQTNLGTIFLTRLALGSTLKVIIPSVMSHLADKANSKGNVIHELTEAEKEFNLMEYHVMLGPFQDYAEAAIQYGYATMFVAAYPLAAIMSFVNNYIELRVDAWKLLQQSRRPEPRSAEDIGTWQSILEIVSIFAMIINAALISFTGTFVVNYTWNVRAWIFMTTACGIYLYVDVPIMFCRTFMF